MKADPFFMDAKFNDPNPNNRRRRTFSGRPGVPLPLAQDPVADWLGLGENALDTSRLLQLQVNTNQFGRTFEDRTHTFMVMERPADVPMDRRIVNLNIRGRRGNIVQVYPSVEYDFIPSELQDQMPTITTMRATVVLAQTDPTWFRSSHGLRRFRCPWRSRRFSLMPRQTPMIPRGRPWWIDLPIWTKTRL